MGLSQDDLKALAERARKEALDAVNATGDRSRSVWRRYTGFALIVLAFLAVVWIVKAVL